MIHYIATHHALDLLIFYIIASNAINAMPAPNVNSGAFYNWAFTFLHAILLQAGRYFNKSNSTDGVKDTTTIWKPDFPKGDGK